MIKHFLQLVCCFRKEDKNIARIANAVHCHNLLSDNNDCHEFRFSIVRIVISVSNVTSLQDCLFNCQNCQKLSELSQLSKLSKKIVKIVDKIQKIVKKLSHLSKIIKNCPTLFKVVKNC